jgi:asparagine synthase (glutamine-hydrolysing)
MCGIAGMLLFDGSTPDAGLVNLMVTSLVHRGPDDQDAYIAGPVALGHSRLSIIDPSASGNQPISNEDKTLWVSYNGEIYNFLDIRNELLSRGHAFKSATDTEVVVHAYEEWGVECIKYFNGMFSFALWDFNNKSLWLVRDRLGIKPLFYCYTPDFFLFGSEIKAILSTELVDRSIDFEALAYFLALNYMPAPFTLFSSVRQVLPGHYLLVDLSGQKQDVEYWDLVYQESNYRKEKEYVEEFSDLLEDSVRLRLISDVPLGVFLSGGTDSSSVAYWMAQNTDEPVKTFTVGFGESSFDELEYARRIAKTIGSDHHERIVKANAALLLPKIVWHSEEPTADSSMIAVYHLAELTREYVKVALAGDGADELLAGYETYQAYYLHRLYRFFPTWFRQEIIRPLIDRFPVSDSKLALSQKLRRFAHGGDLSSEDAHAVWRIIFTKRARSELLKPIIGNHKVNADVIDLYRRAFAMTNAVHPVNRMLYVDTRLYLPNDMLVKVDRMTMAHGLEAREPFLDHRLVEFLASVPPNLKLHDFFYKKYLLKSSMKDKLPATVLYRKKQGFSVPNSRWIKQSLKSFVMDILSTGHIREMGILNTSEVELLLKNHFAERADNSHQIWCLLTLVIWWDLFIKRKSYS